MKCTLLLIFLIEIPLSLSYLELIHTLEYNKKFPIEPSYDYFKKIPDNLFLVEVQLGTPLQTFTLMIDTTSYITWIQSNTSITPIPELQNTYNKALSSTHTQPNNKKINYFYNKQKCEGKFIKDKLQSSGIQMDFEFALIDEYSSSLNKIDGILGLAREFPKVDSFKLENSFIRKANGAIKGNEMNIFTILYSNPPTITFGEDNRNFNKLGHIGSCDIIQHPLGYWGCHSNRILHNNTYIEIDTNVVFDSSIEKIVFPDKLKKYFLKKKLISKKHCKEFQQDEGTYFICHSLEDYLPFGIVLNEMIMKLPPVLFTYIYESNKFYPFKMNFSPKYDEIHLGISVFKYYNVNFNDNTKKIKISADNENNIALVKDCKVIQLEDSNGGLIGINMFLFLMIGFILTVIIIWAVIKTQLKKKKNSKTNEVNGKCSTMLIDIQINDSG